MRRSVRRRAAPLILLGLIVGLAGLTAVHPARAQTTQVTIANFAFQPATITVLAGTTVTWTNMDAVPHTSSSDTGLWDSGSLGTNQSFSYTFTQAGTFPYHCAIHPYMHGTVVVQAASPVSPTVMPPPPPPPAAAPTATPTPTPTATPIPPTATPTPPASSGKRQKTILATLVRGKFVFKPAKTTVKVGTRVTWVNQSNALHTVTSRTKRWKYNKKLNPHKKLSVVFRQAGTYKYYCIYHPGMVGTIVVKR